MSNETLTRPEVVDLSAKAQHNDHRFFDPRSPEQPEHIFGIETEAILRLGSAVTALGVLPPRVNLGLYALPDAVRLVPLVEEMQSGTQLTPEDVRPYRKSIKKLSMEVSFADKAAVTVGALAVGIPLRRALNHRIEREFPIRAAEAIDRAREAVASIENIESSVNYVASLKNPKEQFVTELNYVAQTVSSAIIDQRDRRVRSSVPAEAKSETPKGIAGFFTKAVRKVRGFFGMFKRSKPAINPEVTAYDAGAGIEQIITSLGRDRDTSESSEDRLPMISRLLFSRLPDNIPITKDRLALAAPEILNFLFSTSPDDEKGRALIDSVNRNPHELRFITKFKKHYGHYSLEGIQRASVTLMPAIRDALPAEGAKVRDAFAQFQDLLQRKQPAAEIDDEINGSAAITEASRKGFRNRLRKLLRKPAK